MSVVTQEGRDAVRKVANPAHSFMPLPRRLEEIFKRIPENNILGRIKKGRGGLSGEST